MSEELRPTPLADNRPSERTIGGQPTEPGWHWIKDAKGAWQAVWIEKFPSGSLWACIPSSGKTDDQWWKPVARLTGEWGPRIPKPDQLAPAPSEGVGQPGSIMPIPEGCAILPPPGPQDIVARAVQTGKTMTLKEWSESMLEKAQAPDPDNLEGPPPTTEQRAEMARELDRIAPTPADKFALMFGHPPRPTPRTDAEYTYASKQATDCAGCGKHKHTPLRRDEMGGYVCLTCIDKRLEHALRELAEARERADLWEKRAKERTCTATALLAQRDRLAECLDHLREKDWFREGVTGRDVVCSLDPDKVRAALKGGSDE